MIDNYYMNIALQNAKRAFEADEVPVGAVIVKNNNIIASTYNLIKNKKNPTAHAEILAIQEACMHENSERIPNTTLYVTLEPCFMCVGAIILARIDRVVFGATDPKTGAVVSIANLLTENKLNHKCEVTYKVMEEECSNILKLYFKVKRGKNRITT